jgi:hypothetical protein
MTTEATLNNVPFICLAKDERRDLMVNINLRKLEAHFFSSTQCITFPFFLKEYLKCLDITLRKE